MKKSSGSHKSTQPTVHTDTYHATEAHPYHQTGNIRTSSVEYHPTHKYYFYPIMNHYTKSYDTIKGSSPEIVQAKVNSYGEPESRNWLSVVCVALVVSAIIYLLYSYFKNKDNEDE